MRYIWGFLVIAFSAFLIGSPAFAITDTTLSFTFTVKTIFQLSLNTSTIDFGSVVPNEKKVYPTPVVVTAQSNTGKPWSVQISAPSDFISQRDAAQSMDISTLHWKATQAISRVETGTLITERQAVSKILSLVYQSPNANAVSLDNINTDTGGTQILMDFDLLAPFSATAGDYETVLLFTLTEG